MRYSALQDADELGIAMESEKALLEQWRTYRGGDLNGTGY
ncbi:tail fiber assembly protein [Pantoea sp. SGAir0180]